MVVVHPRKVGVGASTQSAGSSTETPRQGEPFEPSEATSTEQSGAEPPRSRRRLSPRVAEAVDRIEGTNRTDRDEVSSASAQGELEVPVPQPEAETPVEVEATAPSAEAEVYGPLREESEGFRHQEYWCGMVDHDCLVHVGKAKLCDGLVAAWNDSGNFMVMKKGSDEVDPATLTEEDWSKFMPALESEWAGAVVVGTKR
eukprot:5866216-Amphidinium_carterae.1